MTVTLVTNDETNFPTGATYNIFDAHQGFIPAGENLGVPVATTVSTSSGIVVPDVLTAKKAYVAEKVDNLVANGSLDTNATGWNNAATDRNTTGATVTRDTTTKQSGAGSLKVVTGATATGKGADNANVTVVAGHTYRASCWALGGSGSESVKLVLGDTTTGAAAVSGTAGTLSSSTWTYLTAIFTATSSGTSGVAVVSAGSANITFYADNIAVEDVTERGSGRRIEFEGGTPGTTSADPTKGHPVARRGGVSTLT
jgi:hypothetical protein